MNRELLEAPFAPAYIKQREGNFGQTLDYVEANVVIQRLNDALDGNWCFEIVKYEIREECSEVLVLGKLSAGDIVKTQFGSSKITRNRSTGEMVSLADDLKAAATDSLKKSATLLGVGLYLYADGKGAPGQKDSPPHSPRAPESRTRTHQAPASSQAGRLSSKQLQLIHKLSEENGLTRGELNVYCQHNFGRVTEFLSRPDASRLIESLFAGEVSPSRPAA